MTDDRSLYQLLISPKYLTTIATELRQSAYPYMISFTIAKNLIDYRDLFMIQGLSHLYQRSVFLVGNMGFSFLCVY